MKNLTHIVGAMLAGTLLAAIPSLDYFIRPEAASLMHLVVGSMGLALLLMVAMATHRKIPLP